MKPSLPAFLFLCWIASCAATWPSSWQTRDECPQLSCPSVYIPPECRQTDYTYVNGRRCPACDIDLCQRDSNRGGSADRWSNNNRGNSRDSWDRNRGGSGDQWDSRGNNRDRWDNNRIGSFDNNRDGNWDSNNRVGSGSNWNNNRGGSWDSNRGGSGSNWDNNRGNRWDSQGRSADRNSQWDSNRSGRNVDTSRSGSVTFERTRGGVSWDNDRNRNRWDNNRGGSVTEVAALPVPALMTGEEEATGIATEEGRVVPAIVGPTTD
uniref:Uncharacterized protein LOC111109225 n=1 Tax=Crassostrea virginica TaxID=6565 RepID=A0A8B8BCU5_CRAVI|nr:uncharacterized protein LOC111109225 [Crassostrea virginica]